MLTPLILELWFIIHALYIECYLLSVLYFVEPAHTGHHTRTHLHQLLKQGSLTFYYHIIVLCKYLEPEMADINAIVIPHIQSEWEDVAYALRYKIATVNNIKAKNKDNPKKCCKELFIDWLSTDHGVGPKTWSTLIKELKKIEELAAATSEILNELGKLSDS